MTIELGDSSRVRCVTSDLVCDLEFKTKVSSSRMENMIGTRSTHVTLFFLGLLFWSMELCCGQDQKRIDSRSLVWDHWPMDQWVAYQKQQGKAKGTMAKKGKKGWTTARGIVLNKENLCLVARYRPVSRNCSLMSRPLRSIPRRSLLRRNKTNMSRDSYGQS